MSTSNSSSWLGKLSGLSPRSKYESRDPSPSPAGRRQRGSSTHGTTQQSSFRAKVSMRPRSMSPFGMRRSRSKDNISESSFNVDDLRATDDGGSDAWTGADSSVVDDTSSMQSEAQSLQSSEYSQAELNPVDDEKGDVGDDMARRSGIYSNIEDSEFDMVQDEPIYEITDELSSPSKKPAILEGLGNDTDFTIQRPDGDIDLHRARRDSNEVRVEEHPLRASQVALGLDDEDEDAVGSYHFKETGSPPSHTPAHKTSPPLGTHIDIHGSTSTELLDTQRMAYDALRTPPPKARKPSSPSSPTSPSIDAKKNRDLLEQERGPKTRLNRFSSRRHNGSPVKAPSAPPRSDTSTGSGRKSRVSKRGSTPRGSSLDGREGRDDIIKKPPSSPPQSTYVKHLETELETLRSDRSTLMQTILDLKQENEENAQVAARLDDDNGDERLSLSHRINELDEALQKANTTIKLLRLANHTLKKEMEEVKFDNHSMRSRLNHLEGRAEGHGNGDEGRMDHTPRKRSSQSAIPSRSGSASKSKPPPPPPTFSPPPSIQGDRGGGQLRSSHHGLFDQEERGTPSKRRTSQSMGRMMQRPTAPPPEPPPFLIQRSPPSSPPALPPPSPSKAKSPDQAPPPLPPPRSISRGKVNETRDEPPVPPPRSSSKVRKNTHFFGEEDGESDGASDRSGTLRSSESQIYNQEERKSEIRRSEPENLFRNPEPSPLSGRLSKRGPSPLSRSSRPLPVSSPRSRSANSSLKSRTSSSGSKVSPRSSSGTRISRINSGSSAKGLSDVEEQLNESSTDKDDSRGRVNRKSPAQARIVKEDEHLRGRSSTRKQIVRPPSPSPARRPSGSSPATKGSPMRAPPPPVPASPSSSVSGNGNSTSGVTSTPRGGSTRRSLPRDSGMSDLLSYVPTPRLKNGTPRSRSHTPVSSSSSSSSTTDANSRGTRSRSHTPSSPASSSAPSVSSIRKGGSVAVRQVREHRTSSSPRSGATLSKNSMPTPWSAHPLASPNLSKTHDNASSLLRTSPDFHPASPPKERPVEMLSSAFTTPVKSEEMKAPRRLSTGKKPPPKPTTPSSMRGKKPITQADIPARDIATRHSESSFSLTDIEEKPFHQHRNKARSSASGFTTEELEHSIPIGRSFLESNIINTDKGMLANAPTTSSPSSSSSTTSSHHRPPISSPTPSSSSKTSKKAQNNHSPPRFKEPTESVEEATARRVAYKEKCEREILEFQKSLLLEENDDEDLSYLKVQPRTNIIRRSASLDRERLEAASHE